MNLSLHVVSRGSGTPRRTRGLWSPDGLKEVESAMTALAVGATNDVLGAILDEHLQTGGKRLRARLALATCEALAGEREAAVAWGAAVEMLHNASLLHDDVQDGDRTRRGREAVWVRHGVAQAINAGDLGLMLPYVAVADVPVDDAAKWALSNALAQHAERVARGQAEELTLLRRRRLGWDDYVNVAREKTAALFSLPVFGAAVAAGLTPIEARAVAAAVEPVGVLFQIQDDVLDLFGEKGRERAGSDIAEGKVTALVVEHLRLHPADRAWLVDVLDRSPESTDEASIDEVCRRFADGGALRAVWDRMADLETQVTAAPALARHPRLQALALDLVAGAVTPIAHTAPVDVLLEGLGG